MTAFLQFLKGYLIISVSGFSPERFMNLCSNNNILLWNINRENGKYEMCIFLKAFYKLRPIVKKTGTRVVILKRIGLPFLIPKLKKRKVFIAGLVLTLFLAVISSGFIWSIDVSGNIQVTDDMFFSFLEERNVKISSYKKKINIDDLEKDIRKAFPCITWVGVKFSGTRLLINIKENETVDYAVTEKYENGMDLVGEYEGKIVRMIVRSGVPKVKIGDEVSEGTILVEGKVPVYNEDGTVREYQFVDADGDIYLEHEMFYEDELSLKYKKKNYTGRESKYFYVRINNKTYSFFERRKYLYSDCLTHEEEPDIMNKIHIPICLGTVTEREYQIFETKYSKNEAKSILLKNLMIFLESLSEKGVQIIEKNVKIEENELTMKISGEIRVWEKVEMKLPTQKSPEA